MTELATVQTSLTEQMDFAAAVVRQPDRGGQSLLPREYQGNPANVLIAVGLGQSMGLSPAESLYRITVIQGKPTAAAELIASNVRKAGHKLRVRVTENPPSATCTIVRADDPDEPTVITRDMDWAAQMGLATKDNYKKQPSTMLSWRAISACARLACPEALYGVSYTPDEMAEAAPVASSGGLGAALAAEQVANPEPSAPEPDSITSAQQKKMGAAMRELGITDRDMALQFVADVVGREVTSRNDLTKDEASRVIEALKADLADVAAPVDGEIVEEPS